MRRDHVHDGVARHTERVEHGQVSRQRVVGAGVDERGAALCAQHQVGGVESRAVKAGVDGKDVVAEVFDEVRQHRPILGTAFS